MNESDEIISNVVWGETYYGSADPNEYRNGDIIFKLMISAVDNSNKNIYGFLSYGNGNSIEEQKQSAFEKLFEFIWNEHYYNLSFCDLINDRETTLYHIHRKDIENLHYTELDTYLKNKCYCVNVYDEFKEEMVNLFIDKDKIKFLLVDLNELKHTDFDDITGEPIVIVKPAHGKLV